MDSNVSELTRENSEQIGFVVACLYSSAISLSELRNWCMHTIGRLDTAEIPAYMFDLAEFDGELAKVFQIIGFVPHWNHSEDEESALFGIAVKRGATRHEWPVPPEAALAKLGEYPSVEVRFKRVFPFIRY